MPFLLRKGTVPSPRENLRGTNSKDFHPSVRVVEGLPWGDCDTHGGPRAERRARAPPHPAPATPGFTTDVLL